MNTIYRIIWNVATGKWVVASELAKSRRKTKGRVAGKLASCAAVLGLGMAVAPSAFAANYVVALFNDAKDGTCTSLTDQATAPGMYSNGACTQSLGTGTATATSQDPFLNLISNQNGLFVGGGLEIYGNGVASGPAAYIHGGLSLFSGAGMTGSANKIFGVASGDLNSASTDAVNGSQLYATNQQVSVNTTAITNLDGRVTTVDQQATVNSNNITSLGSRVTTVEGDVTNLTTQMNTGSVGLVQQATPGASLTVGKDIDGASVDFADKDGNYRTLSHIKGGTDDYDAVALWQLKGTTNAMATNVATALGGGATVTGDLPLFSAPTYTVQGGTQHDVGTALDALDGGLTAAQGDVTSLQGSVGSLQGAMADALAYDDTTHGSVTLGGASASAPVALRNVASGELSAASTDAVNGSQLYATNQQVSTNATNIANVDNRVTTVNQQVTANTASISSLQSATADVVAYDDTTHGSVTLGGVSASAPVALRNVASGELSATSTDAVNGSQLYATNAQVSTNATNIANVDSRVTTVEGDVTNLDGRVTTVEGSVTSLTSQMNTGAVGLVQQAAAGAGLTVGKDTDGASVDFADKDGNARTLTSIGAGTADTDAVNVGQLKGTANSVAVALGAGASINADGTLGAPTYTVQGGTQHDVGTALDALDGGLKTAQGDVTSLQGSVGSLQGAMADAVAYDDTTHGSVTLGGASASAPVALRNVASGELSATSTDAVNGSQLYATNAQVSTNATNIANVDSRVTTVEGDVTNLGGRVTMVESDVTNLDNRFTTVEGSVTNLTNQMNTGVVGLVQQAAPGAGLTVGKGIDGASVDFADKDGNTRTLTSIGAGTADTDAVNVSQLKSSLASAGLVDDNGHAVAAVTYDKNADGTPNYGSVTMGGGKAAGPVTIKNVAAGVDDTDAVNVSQLKATGLFDGSGNAMDAVVYDAGSNRSMITLGGAGALAPVTLTNVANGKSTYDAVNFGQLSSLQSELLSQISTVSNQVINVSNQVTAIDSRVTNIQTDDAGLGGSLPYLDSSASGGSQSNANAGDASGLALGYDSVATGENASAIGQGAQALGSNGLAVGNGAYAAGPSDTAIGGNAKVNADHSTALGANSSVAASATNAVAVGAESQVNASSGTAIGQGASVAASANNAVAIGAGSLATQANSVSVGSAGNERVITNVAAGVNATDAVNVSQLQSTQNWAQNYMDRATSTLNNRINSVGRDAAAGTAAAIATANIPQAYAPNQGSIGAGVGTFNGQSAVAVGLSTVTPSGRWILKANLTGNNRGDVGAGFGAAMVW